MQLLFAWLGQADLDGAGLGTRPAVTPGPIARALRARVFSRLVLLSNYNAGKARQYADQLAARMKTPVSIEQHTLSDPTAYDEIYEAAKKSVRACREELGSEAQFTYHLSPGTSAMAVVWILLAKSEYPATLLEASRQAGVKDVHFPFEMAAEFVPRTRASDDAMVALAEARAPTHASFDDIVATSAVMKDLMWRGEQLASRKVPVLIEGESGTGKELLARAIHQAGPTAGKPLVAVNCGAIPAELLESELFGHTKGAFTGAVQRFRGCFERANGSTLFLDEIGELPLDAQVRLLRVVQEREVRPLGSETSVAVDVRIIAATNRSLAADVRAGRFREDLFYRLAVAVLTLPPIRERPGDLTQLINAYLQHVNEELQVPGYVPRSLSVGARRILLEYHWPGNVRELQNVLFRAALWSITPEISPGDIRFAMSEALRSDEMVLRRSLGDGFRLEAVIAEVYRHYLVRGFAEGGRTQTGAAKLLGISNYQTFANLCRKYGVPLTVNRGHT